MTTQLPEAPSTVRRWHEMFNAKDFEQLAALLDDSVVVRSPVLEAPQEGKENALRLLGLVLSVIGDVISYQREWYGPDSAVLEFAGELDGITLQGVDIIRWNDSGRIVDLTVMARPLPALQHVSQVVQSKLAGG
jgi:SnoaL-like protein